MKNLNDIVEVWFDSGSTHSFVLEKRKDLKWPADMYLEGSDQHRGWFHSSLLESCGTRGKAPFKSILSHGFVVDGKGLKMSKSTWKCYFARRHFKKLWSRYFKNYGLPHQIMQKTLRIDKSILTQHAESYRKIRNTFQIYIRKFKDNYEKQDFNKLNFKNFNELRAVYST